MPLFATKGKKDNPVFPFNLSQPAEKAFVVILLYCGRSDNLSYL
jgi:hypothetical protein